MPTLFELFSDRSSPAPSAQPGIGWGIALFVAAAVALIGSGTAFAGAPSATATQVYEEERARCESGQTGQSLQSCLTSAGAALQEARAGKLDTAEHPYEENRLRRCDALPESDRADCKRRMAGAGTTSGSVEGGGIFRELITREPQNSGTGE